MRNILLLMAGFALLAGGVYLISQPMGPGVSVPEGVDPAAVVEKYRARLFKGMRTGEAIQATVERNAMQFSCLYSETGACKDKGDLILFYDSRKAGTQTYTQTPPTSGLSFEETPCNTFPSAKCPFRVEARWSPVCNGNNCEATKSLYFYGRVFFDLGNGSKTREPITVEVESPLLTLNLNLSQRSRCARGGGVYNGVECLTGNQLLTAQDRANAEAAANEQPMFSFSDRERQEQGQMINSPMPQVSNFNCPGAVYVQGEQFPVSLAADTGVGTAYTPSINGCTGEQDKFSFRCVSANNPENPTEGQWLQVEAQLSPMCGQDRNVASESSAPAPSQMMDPHMGGVSPGPEPMHNQEPAQNPELDSNGMPVAPQF